MRVIAIGLAAIPLAFLMARHSDAPAQAVGKTDLRLSRISSELAQRPVQVHCRPNLGRLTGKHGESGSVGFDTRGRPGDFSEVADGVCSTLHAYSRSTNGGDNCLLPCQTRPFDVAWSMNTVAHEAYHLAGIRNEAQTECYAIQAVPFVARRLGASPQQARALGLLAANRVLAAMPPEYMSPQCRDGGAFDLHPATPGWP
ncbi:MAG: hypothetical protein M3R70_10420 [Actinomycetota bacterium]|nr:hypothetical protein [Actinomycetota bacterium]